MIGLSPKPDRVSDIAVRVAASFRRPAVWGPLAVIPVMLLILEPSGWDVWLQDFLWDASGERHWIVDAHAEGTRLLFYRLPRLVITVVGLAALAAWIAGFLIPFLRPWRRQFLFFALAVALVPGVTGLLKAVTNVHCPSQLTRYGGDQAYDGFAARLFEPVVTTTRGRCFPAGHASGGYALLALGWSAATRRGRMIGWMTGLAVGSVLGAYQMAKGVHFMSHTLATLLLAMAITAWLAGLFWYEDHAGNRLQL